MEIEKNPRVAAGVIILNEKNEILLLLRSKNTRNDHGMWSIPGGKVEWNESVEQTAKRETQEECGVQIEKIKHLGYVDHVLEEYDQHWVSQLFLAEKWTGEAKNGELDRFDDIQWFSLNAIPKNSSAVVFKAVELFNCSTWNNFQEVDIRVGKILSVELLENAKYTTHKITVDFGEEIGIKTSGARLVRYSEQELIGKQILGVVNMPKKQIGKLMSEFLTLGVPDASGECILITPDSESAVIGGRLY